MPCLAHSARKSDGLAQSYRDHVAAVRDGALERADAMLSFCNKDKMKMRLRAAIEDAAIFHDLGKLDPENQVALQHGRGMPLPWDHIDAGVAHLMAAKAQSAAWLVRAHHAPGLPSWGLHFQLDADRNLRGCRNDERTDVEAHAKQIARTDATLAELVDRHSQDCNLHVPRRYARGHGIPLRLALSCLVDADHADTAQFDTGEHMPEGNNPRWQDRLDRLDAYVAGLPPADDL
jgi:CRISPR-associated endonuclease/helicase Cas3